jgi:hypothetical protein
MILIRNVPDIGMGARYGDLAGTGEIEMSEPADVVSERRLSINLVHTENSNRTPDASASTVDHPRKRMILYSVPVEV